MRVVQIGAVGVLLAALPLGADQLGASPGPPGTPVVTLTGSAVKLTWQAPTTGGPVEAYLIEAGSTSGASDYGVFNVGATTTVSAEAPHGNYYVRVVAINAAGRSAPSTEAAFTVGGPPTSSPSLRCVAFGPYVAGYSPIAGNHPTTAVIDSLVDIIATQTSANCLMTFGVLDGLDHTFEAARRRGLKVIAILWLGESLANDRATIALGALRARQYPDTIVRIACGSELRTRLGSARAAALISDCVTRLRIAGVSQPIGTNETWWSMCDQQWPCRRWDAVGDLDWLGINVYAWWENKFSGLFPCIPAAQAADFHVSRFQDVRAVYSEKELIFTEFGWPAGPDGYRETNEQTGTPGCGVASRDNQLLVVTQTVDMLMRQNISFVVFSAFREPWKIVEGAVGPWWGVLVP